MKFTGLKRLMMAASVILPATVNVCSQDESDIPSIVVKGPYEEVKTLRAERIMKHGDRYSAVVLDIDWLVGPTALQPILAEKAFNVEADAPNRALNAFIAKFDSVFTKQQKPIEVGDSLIIVMKNMYYKPGRYISYSMLKYEKTDGKITKTEDNFTYDLMHNKELALSDIYNSKALSKKKLENIASSTSIDVSMSKITYWKGDNPNNTVTDDFFKEDGMNNIFTEQFETMTGISKLASFLFFPTPGKTFSLTSTFESAQFKEAERILGRIRRFKQGHSALPMSEEKKATNGYYPEYTGGKDKLKQYISENTILPIDAEENGFTGDFKVYILINKEGTAVEALIGGINEDIISTFDSDGRLTVANLKKDIICIYGITALEKELTRVVKGMPKWTPAKDKKGNPVESLYPININFVPLR